MSRETLVTWPEIIPRSFAIRDKLEKLFPDRQNYPIYGVPRGGCSVAAMVGYPVDFPDNALAIVDDVVDSGETKKQYTDRYPDKPFLALYDKTDGDRDKGWLIFPWETMDKSRGPEDAVIRMIEFIGEDPTRAGLIDTPARVLRAMRELTSGYEQDPKEILSAQFNEGHDEMVVVRDMRFNSLCEHHMLPFHGKATIGYIPRDGVVVGLSKLPRLVHAFSRRLQIQERLTQQIVTAIMESLNPLGAGCVMRAIHTCASMRGVKTDTEMVTSCLLGNFRDSARAEFLSLAVQ